MFCVMQMCVDQMREMVERDGSLDATPGYAGKEIQKEALCGTGQEISR